MNNITNNKLYPPYIEGNLPAFSFENIAVQKPVEGKENEFETIYEDHAIIYIQYTMNKGVSQSQIDGYSLQVKKITTNQIIGTFDNGEKLEDNNIIKFDLGKDLVLGQYYKFQLAFKGENNITGFYSTPGIARYINRPAIEIINFDSEAMRVQSIYDPLASGEYLYSYKFKLYKGEPEVQKELIEDSDEIIFNSANVDGDNRATLTYNFKYQPVYGQKYYVEFEIKTGNSYETWTRSEIVQALPSIMPTSIFKLEAKNNYDNGYIEIAVRPLEGSSELATGGFRLGRSSSKDNFKSYEEILSFELINEIPNKFLYRDYFIEHGVEYRYAYQQYNIAYKNKTEGAIISRHIWSNQVEAKFEDLFLSDGETQFKVKYNPKVSSIKTTLQEAKVDTLGGQYPFIFRNGNVRYHEFPISGLISYLEDEEEIFMERPFGFSPTINLTEDNINVERQFKFKVMDWLNNGEVKYFKSPAEGSYLVRLMNVSLTPNDQLGRMLHTFNATAYEVGDINKTNLEKYKFILPNRFIPSENIATIKEVNLEAHQNITLNNILNLEFFINQDNPGDISINSLYRDKINEDRGTLIKINNSPFFIPAYIQNYSLQVSYDSVVIETDVKPVTLIYTCKNIDTVASSEFEKIISVNKRKNGQKIEPNLQIRQLAGTNAQQLDVKNAIENELFNTISAADNNLTKQIAFFSFLQFYKNPDIPQAFEWDENNFKIEINGTIIDLKETRSYLLNNIDYIISLNIGPGLILECGYYLNFIDKE